MYKVYSREQSITSLVDLIKDGTSYLRTHCWQCEKEFSPSEEVYDVIPYNSGRYCKECSKLLSQALILDSSDVEVKYE